MRYVITALETKQEFSSIMTFLFITVLVFGSISLYNSYINGKIMPFATAIVNQGLNKILFQKSRKVELSCFEDPEFYNKYTLAMENADEQLIKTVDNIWSVLFGFITTIAAFVLMFQVDRWSILFILFPVIGNFVFDRAIGKDEFARNVDMAPYNRKINYVNRVMFTFSFIFEGLLIYGAYRTLVSQTMSLAQLAVIASMMVASTWILIGFTTALMDSFRNGLFVDNLRYFLEYEETIPEDYEGEIFLNRKNIKTYNLQKYRHLFATAFQDHQLFSLSVVENVLMEKETESNQHQAVEALKLAGVWEKISSLPKGIHTTLTREFDDEGAVLSGGEYQKVVVARAFAKECPFKIFDEPSSALDPIAEYSLNKAMHAAAENKTVFYISHRLSTTRDADRIIMLENGQIIEEGTHAKLLALNGKYAKMWEAQASNYQ